MEIGKVGTSLITTDTIPVSRPELLNNFVKLGILSALAGYKKQDRVFVNGRFSPGVDIGRLGRFMSYVVNHPAAPKHFDFQLTQNRQKGKEALVGNDLCYDIILSFSGGIDSTAGLLYCLDNNLSVLPLWIDFDQRNKVSEMQAAQRILARLGMRNNQMNLSVGFGDFILKGWEDWSFIVPARNFIFIALAEALFFNSSKGKGTIYLCANREEMRKWKHRDKSAYFFRTASSFFKSDSGKNIVVTSPFREYSKTEILYWWKNHWEKKYGISPYDTSTCYYNSGACGRCRACFRRTVSLLCAGYDADRNLEHHPLTDPVGLIKNEWIPEIRAGKISREGRLDFYIALEKTLDLVPRYLTEFYKQLPSRTKSAITRRKAEITAVELKEPRS